MATSNLQLSQGADFNPNAAPQSSYSVANNSAFGGPNATQAANANTALGITTSPQPSTTFDAGALSQPNQNVQFPTNPPNTGTSASNALSFNSTIPSPASIINEETTQTPAGSTNTSLLGKLAGLIGGQSSLATQQGQQEKAAGIPGLTKTVNDLTSQILALNDQSTALSAAAMPGGTIQNTEQNNAQGRGITAGGLAPQTSADLRNNQIQQSIIAQQSLVAKSAYYAANNNLTLAKDAADKAAQIAFDADTQKINYTKALIDANKPQMTKEEKAQADLVTAQLADRTRQLDEQKTDYTTGIGLINNAMKFNGQDPQAQLAIQAAQKVDPKDPQYLQKVGALLTQYQQDPVATQKALADLANTKANTANTYSQIADRANPNSKPPTATQTTYANYAPRLETADKIINDMTPALSKLPVPSSLLQKNLPSYLQSADFQSYYQAQKNFVGAILRQESGAAVPDSEIKNYTDQYFPQPGDSQAVIDQKAQNRAQVVASYRTAAGPAYVAPIGTVTPGVLRSPDGKQQVNKADLTPAQLTEAATAGWK